MTTDVDAVTEREILETYLDCSENTKEFLFLVFDELEYKSRRKIIERLDWVSSDIRRHLSTYERYVDKLINMLNDGSNAELHVNSQGNIIFISGFPERLTYKLKAIEKLPDVFRIELEENKGSDKLLKITLVIKYRQSQEIINALRKLQENYINLYLKKKLNND